MSIYFGTDGLRGQVNVDLTGEIAHKCGNALSFLTENPTILIGRDTRVSGSYLSSCLACGAMQGGAKVIDIGVVPTAGIAFLTKLYGADYGVVISASHNSKEYNGIKIFSKTGYKLNEKEEERVERSFIRSKTTDFPNVGTFEQDFTMIKKYRNFLISQSKNSLKGLTIVLDGSNGAAHKIAPEVFRALGASVIASNCFSDGLRINEKCGALYPETLAKRVLRYKADVGFSFDGDADRVIAVDENGRIIDGDMIIFAIATYLKEKGKLNKNTAVGTGHTNLAIELALKEKGIDFIRTDIGDKYVLEKLVDQNLSVGGEQSGHVILKDVQTTGDGILTAIFLANLLVEQNKKASQLCTVELFPQTNLNVIVKDKYKVMNNTDLMDALFKFNNELGKDGRLMLRASGTEPKVRIMVESENVQDNQRIARALAVLVREADAI